MAEVKRSSQGRSDILAIGFAMVVAMWASGYISRLLPGIHSAVVFFIMIGILLAGGWASGRYSGRGAAGGLMSGLLAGIVNLLVLGSVVGNEHVEGVPSIAVWGPLSIIAHGLICMLGALAGKAGYSSSRTPCNWTGIFAITAATATYILLFAGGILTSERAGMAVPDWPNSFGTNMFLFPLERMTGGIYYEHAHRLLGTLVGLISIFLAVHLALVDKRRVVKVLGFTVLLMVIVQGIFGGKRVELNDLTLAFVHGSFAQAVLATFVAIAALVSTTWKSAVEPIAARGAASDKLLTRILVGALLVQITLGSLIRHIDMQTHLHITLAVLIVGYAFFLGIRIANRYEGQPLLALLGNGLVGIVVLQLLLGFWALVGRGVAAKAGQLYSATHTEIAADPPTIYVLSASIHQIVGASLLAWAVLTALWCNRLLRQDSSAPPDEQPVAQ
ncbi:MAG: COX15/CtaA family protein [Planctomycetales bacterium]|nr:COX15/CtaA family protein [bacterium]UNM07232.1 MAG: COX15/CtaA family protein [Planctomycetales bacterium]